MEENDIHDGNQFIAQFMGGYLRDQGRGDVIWDHKNYMSPLVGRYPLELEYATNWSWLMPVVEKIEKLPGVSVHMQNDLCEIKPGLLRPLFTINVLAETKIEATYKAVVEFVQYYNSRDKQINA